MTIRSTLKKLGRFLARTWVWIPVTLGVLFILCLIALPYGIRYGLDRWLVSHGAEQVRIEDVDFNPFIGQLALRNLQMKTGGTRTLTLSQADIRFSLWPLLHRQIVIGELYLRDPSLTVERSAEGRWRIAGLDGTLAEPDKNPDKKPSWDFILRRATINNGEVRYTSPAITGLAHIDQSEIEFSTHANGTGSNARVRLNGRLHLDQAKPGMIVDTNVSVEIAVMSLSDESGTWNVTGKGQLRDTSVDWTEGKIRIVSAGQIDLQGLSAKSSGLIAIQSLGADQLVVARSTARGDAPGTLGMTKLRLSDIHLMPEQALDIAEISLYGLQVVARHEASLRWYGFSTVNDFLRQFAKPDETGATLAVRIGAITLADAGTIEFSDASVTPAYRARATITRAQLTGLDTGPRPTTPATMALSARIGKYTTGEWRGKIRAFTPRLSANIDTKLREIEMPPLSPYVVKMLGYRIVNGQLNGDLELRIDNGRLDGRSKLALENLNVAPKDDASAEQLKERLSVPLESGLAMLRDKDNNVRLEVNITGDVSDPRFDLTDAINQALTRAMRSASVSYLKLYFQPYGALITVAELAGKAMQLRLDPVPFPPGGATAMPEAQDYLAKVGKLLQERASLRLKLCGKAVPEDKLAETEARLLASQRAEMIKDFLASEYGIATDRLFLCEPDIDRDAEAKPRVELAF